MEYNKDFFSNFKKVYHNENMYNTVHLYQCSSKVNVPDSHKCKSEIHKANSSISAHHRITIAYTPAGLQKNEIKQQQNKTIWRMKGRRGLRLNVAFHLLKSLI